MITVFNNFTSGTNTGLPKVDVLIWIAGLLKYRSFGYRTKLYCTKNDIQFLKEKGLYDLYDEIDDEFLEGKAKEALSRLNGKRFWSARKLECLYHEWVDLGNRDSIYSDTDVTMNVPFDLNGKDLLVWSPEIHKQVSIYVPWDMLTSPYGYERPEFISNCDDAFNCGVIWFRDFELFKRWYAEYHRWADGNPCMISPDIVDGNNNIFACNGEQRILKAVADDAGIKVGFVMNPQNKGICDSGSHWYWYRVIWRLCQKQGAWCNEGHESESEPLVSLNIAILNCLKTIKELNPGLFDKISAEDWLKGFRIEQGADSEGKGNLKLFGFVHSYD